MNIIPWPVIESKQFYAYFVTLKNALDKQVLTHPSAGNFLQTLKTLMAKLKVCVLFELRLASAELRDRATTGAR